MSIVPATRIPTTTLYRMTFFQSVSRLTSTSCEFLLNGGMFLYTLMRRSTRHFFFFPKEFVPFLTGVDRSIKKNSSHSKFFSETIKTIKTNVRYILYFRYWYVGIINYILKSHVSQYYNYIRHSQVSTEKKVLIISKILFCMIFSKSDS